MISQRLKFIGQDENMKKSGASHGQPASELISKRIAELGDWRGETLARMRKLVKEADPDVVEEWKWMGTPVWSHDGIICTGESYKKVVKLTFAKGASLKDPARLFNSSLDGNVRRAIDIHEGEEVDESAFKALVRQAVALLNSSSQVEAFKSEVLRDSAPRLGLEVARTCTQRLWPLQLDLFGLFNYQVASADISFPFARRGFERWQHAGTEELLVSSRSSLCCSYVSRRR